MCSLVKNAEQSCMLQLEQLHTNVVKSTDGLKQQLQQSDRQTHEGSMKLQQGSDPAGFGHAKCP